ncbi:LuxS/MPP-like metallohydrolase [Polyporus arcularius HHB13444]|uniref:LuxS/MPP-like metallohydrolase n=1 Tax=Polyporus arcularius HHB13444 TaxID=1314778 RepID=A0A5C3PQ45_9APHY|nr:LuxS/MPP-like metallohydrolase [Polyporus arcularius HHB13444]
MSSWKDVPASGGLPPYRLFTGDLEKPSLDDRQYRMVELQNGVRAVLVHDPEADKSAACLAVAVGHMHDPIDAPGMAHFCEHMISKGSEPYPEEEDFESFISAHGGGRNAATGPMITYYWFSINSSLEGGLSRLAAFFHSPLFTESLTAREINAVDSEFKRNLQNDVRRIMQLTKEQSIIDHPWRKFGTGNYVSLSAFGRKGEDDDEATVMRETRRRLEEWWREQYCGSRMGLAVIGKESLDDLASMTIPSFSKIANHGLEPRPAIKEPSWGPEQQGVLIFVQTVKDYHAFSVQFELPDLRDNYDSKPTSFLAHFLGHEGRGSICAYLKRRGWLLDLSVGDSGEPRAVHLFKIEGTLTLEGYLHYESVLKVVFDYISLLRQSFPLEPYHYDEVSTMARTRFTFREKAQPHTYATTLASSFTEPYPPEWLISGASLYRKYDESIVRELLEAFVPERARVLLMAKNHSEEVIGNDPQWLTEKWYGTQYIVRKLDDALLKHLRDHQTNAELFLPAPNPYIPTNLSVDKSQIEQPARYPILVKRTERAQLWHKKDDQFWVPKARVRMVIKTPLAYATARHAMMTRLFVNLVEDALAEVTYDADLAGLSYSLSNDDDGIVVSVGGYNDKLDVLLRTVLEKLRDLEVAADRLKVIAEKVERNYSNYYMGQPSNLSEAFGQWLLMPLIWAPADKLTELPRISESDIQRHRDVLFAKVFMEILVAGNITEDRSLAILAMAEEILQPRPLLPNEIPTSRSLVLQPGSNYVWRRRHENPKEVNSSLTYYCQFGESSNTRLRALAALIQRIIREPCFTILRTKEQLGYVVGALTWSINSSTIGLRIKVQSTRAPWFVEQRVEAFLETFGERLSSMPASEFESHKEGLVMRLLERVKNLSEETTRFWTRIRAGHYDFLRHETDAATVRALTLSEVIEAYNTFLRPSTGAQTRKKLSVQLISQQMNDTPEQAANVQVVEDERTFKASLGCAPAAVPVVSEAFGRYAHGQPSARL